MIKNFLFDICGFTGDFKMEDREKKCIDYIRKTVGKNKVLVRNYLMLSLRTIDADGVP